jgi:hypothetical protein
VIQSRNRLETSGNGPPLIRTLDELLAVAIDTPSRSNDSFDDLFDMTASEANCTMGQRMPAEISATRFIVCDAAQKPAGSRTSGSSAITSVIADPPGFAVASACAGVITDLTVAFHNRLQFLEHKVESLFGAVGQTAAIDCHRRRCRICAGYYDALVGAAGASASGQCAERANRFRLQRYEIDAGRTLAKPPPLRLPVSRSRR